MKQSLCDQKSLTSKNKFLIIYFDFIEKNGKKDLLDPLAVLEKIIISPFYKKALHICTERNKLNYKMSYRN